MYHDVPSRGNLRIIAPKNFSNAAADPIAKRRASQSFLDADAETASRSAIGAIKNHELRRGFPPAAAIDGLEFGAA